MHRHVPVVSLLDDERAALAGGAGQGRTGDLGRARVPGSADVDPAVAGAESVERDADVRRVLDTDLVAVEDLIGQRIKPHANIEAAVRREAHAGDASDDAPTT